MDTGSPSSDSDPDNLYGQIYINADTTCAFGPFRAPKYACQKTVQTWSYNTDPKFPISILFMGNGYMKVQVPGS